MDENRKPNSNWVHSTEQGIVNENNYDCWIGAPVDQGTIQIHRTYQQSPDEVRKLLEENDLTFHSIEPLLVKSEPKIGIPDKMITFVAYDIDLSKLKLPQRLIIGHIFNMDAIERNLAQFSEMGEEAYLSNNYIQAMVDRVVYEASNLIENNRKKGILSEVNFPTKEEFEPHKPNFYTGGGHYEKLLEERYNLKTPLEVLKFTREILTGLASTTASTKFKREADDFLEDRDFTPRRGNGLHPTAAIYHDDWIDPHFESPIPAEIVVGTIPSVKTGQGMDDATSVEEMRREGVNKSWINDQKPFNVPPNMTNLTIFEIPVLPPNIYEFELKSKLIENGMSPFGYKLPKTAMVFCDLPQRLNPVVVKASLDQRYGENGWILVTKDKDNNSIRLVPKPKAEWKITSKSRKEIHLIPDTVI